MIIRKATENDIGNLSGYFMEVGWNKPISQFEKYIAEQEKGDREFLLAISEKQYAGYITIVWDSDYFYFKEKQIPELVDLNVHPNHQRNRIGTQLIEYSEHVVANRSMVIGLGVGLAPGYNAAQRLYAKLGYSLDGNGIEFEGKPVTYGQAVTVNDSLIIHLTKRLRKY
jgi:GNAT superfamily N-acetyltransferase